MIQNKVLILKNARTGVLCLEMGQIELQKMQTPKEKPNKVKQFEQSILSQTGTQVS